MTDFFVAVCENLTKNGTQPSSGSPSGQRSTPSARPPRSVPLTLQLILLSCVVEILSCHGFHIITWFFMSPVVLLGILGPVFAHMGDGTTRNIVTPKS